MRTIRFFNKYNKSLQKSEMDMKCLVVLLAFSAFESVASAEQKGDEFDYEHQAKWYDEYQQCHLNRQSPIELNSQESEVSYDIAPLDLVYYDVPYREPAECVNNGHTANVVLPKPKSYNATQIQISDLEMPHIIGGSLPRDTPYILESLHFHWGSKDAHGSEHVIDGERFSIEMHLLHRNSKYATVEEAREHKDGLAVLAVLYNVNHSLTEDFLGLNEIINTFEAIAEFNHSGEINNLTLSHLLNSMDPGEFYTYAGSLTTPPCSESVTWIVFSHIIPITHRQKSRFHQLSDGHGALLENNYRSLQARGHRSVYLRRNRQVLESDVHSPLYWELLEKIKPINE